MADVKEATFKIRLTHDERAMLEVVAEYTGLSAAAVLRVGIREQFRQLPKKIQDQKK